MRLLLGVAFYYHSSSLSDGSFKKYFKKEDHALPIVSRSYVRLLFQIHVDLSQAKYHLHIAAANSVEILWMFPFSCLKVKISSELDSHISLSLSYSSRICMNYEAISSFIIAPSSLIGVALILIN